MSKKIFTSWLIAVFAILPLLSAPFASAEDSTEVCGVDNQTYASATTAEEAGITVSYDFACTNPSDETNLYEAKNVVNFAGMLVEIGSTDIPTTLIVKSNKDNIDYTIEISEDTAFLNKTELSNWIPGDQIRIIGEKNENTETIESNKVTNLSIKRENSGINGWISSINTNTKEITYQWNNTDHTFSYNNDTKFVVALKNPANAEDLKEGDRIRARLSRDNGNLSAKILVVLRRSNVLFMKTRTFRPNATIVRLNSAIVPTTIQIKLEKTPSLKKDDVNNLIGTEGDLITVNITEDTKLVRKYFGKILLEEFSIGDHISIVGRANDDNTMDAKMIKNNSIWKTSTQGHAGTIEEVNEDENYLIINWTPIKYLTPKALKEKLNRTNDVFTAQTATINEDGNSDVRLRNTSATRRLISTIKTSKKIEKFQRNIINKRVNISRIKHNNIKVSDLIKRLPAKKIKVTLNNETIITVGTNNNALISDLSVGDKIRIRGTRNETLKTVLAETIVVVGLLAEIESDMSKELNDVNTNTSEIVVDEEGADTDENIDGTATENEEIVEDEDSDEDGDEDGDSDEDSDSDEYKENDTDTEDETDETTTSN